MLTIKDLEEAINASSSRISGKWGDFTRSKKYIPQLKLKPSVQQHLIIPLSVGLPFNPLDPKGNVYNRDNLFFFNTSVESAWLLLKYLCTSEESKNREIIFEKLQKALGTKIKPEMWDYTGKTLAHALVPIRDIEPKGDYCCVCKLPAINKFPVKYGIKYDIDATGSKRFTGLLSQISDLEQEFLRPVLKEFYDKRKDGGEYAKLSKEEASTKKRELTRNSTISPPMFYGVNKVLVLNERKETVTQESEEKYAQEGCRGIEFWTTLNKEKMENYLGAGKEDLGTSKDVNPSYLEFRIATTSDDSDAGAMRRWATATRNVVSESEQFKHKLIDFDKKYMEYRDDPEMQSDDLLLSSIRHLRYPEDTVLKAAYQANIKNYSRDLFREEVVEQFGNLISEIDEDLGQGLVKDSIKGKLDDQSYQDDELTTLITKDTEMFVEDAYREDTENVSSTTIDDIKSEVNKTMQETNKEVPEGIESFGSNFKFGGLDDN